MLVFLGSLCVYQSIEIFHPSSFLVFSSLYWAPPESPRSLFCSPLCDTIYVLCILAFYYYSMYT
ncbi:hypothetical protein BDV23DRAFT_147200 [Aspergillus alliaceus]|uniref:Uncharacterized protein n=1 Tax=Petromyces alliaceus TaxID=209559 RepID=A0A5N7CJQ8_PETAA|nr:hypothetical protein BDV23DRAFT_147200 [Aspergillus alliaceus]